MKTVLTSVVLLFLTLGVIPKATAAELTGSGSACSPPESFARPILRRRRASSRKTASSVELVYFQGGSQVIQAMLGGDLPLTVTAGPEGVVAKLQGADIALLSSNNPTMHFSLFVTPEIKKVEDLRGKTAGISRFGSASDFSIRYIFKSAGLSERDVTIVQIGDNPSRLAALKTNADSSIGVYDAQHRAGAQGRFCLAGRCLQVGT